MLRSAKELKGFTVRGTDGDVGEVDDFYFDDEKWTIRYIVVHTGGWLGRRVLISPVSFRGTDWRSRAIGLSLSRDRIRNSPDADPHAPISREYERAYALYYGYAPYWVGPSYWAMGGDPAALWDTSGTPAEPTPASAQEVAEIHIRSSMAVIGYHIQATDGEIGHVDDLIFNDESWAIRYLRIDTSNWIGGKAILVPQRLLQRADWRNAETYVALTKDQIQRSPRYDPSVLNREDEQRLEAYYG
jgi:uncharacterized protein YrrD